MIKSQRRKLVAMSHDSQKVTIKLDKKGRFSIEKLRPLLGDKTDTIKSYTVKNTEDGSIVLQFFDEEGNKV